MIIEGSVDGDSLIQVNEGQRCCLSFCKEGEVGIRSMNSNDDASGSENKSLCKESSTTEEDHTFAEGGWGWIIVVASFFNSFIFDGIGSSYGVLYPYILERFQASAFLTSFGGSMFSAYLIMGSAAAALIKKYGFRAVSFIGGILSCVALIAASYSSSIYLFLLSYGVMGGASVGLVYLSSMVIVNGYFNKKRGITNGIISSGSGMGLLVMAPLINCTLDEYSLNGTILILAGVMFNICVFSSLFRQPKIYSSDCHNHEFKECDGDIVEENKLKESVVEGHVEPIIEIVEEDIANKKVWNLDNDHPPSNLAYSDGLRHEAIRVKDFDRCLGKSENFLSPMKSVDELWKRSPNHLSAQSVFTKLDGQQKRFPSLQSTCLLSDIGTNSYLTGSFSKLMHIHRQHFVSSHQIQKAPSQSDFQSLYKMPVFNDKSFIEEHNEKDTSKKNPLPLDLKFHMSHESLQSNHCESYVCAPEDLPCSVEITSEPFGYSIRELLKKASFHLFCLGACLIQFGYPVPAVFLADLAASHGIPSSQGALMISLIGSFNVGGRLLAGFLANMKINPIRLNDMAMLIAALLCFLCPLFTSKWSLCLFAAIYGFLLGFFPPLQPLIIVKYFGIGSLASTFGFVTTLKGIAGLIGTPLAGWIYDVSLDYSLSIAFAGVAFLLSVIVNEALVYLANRERRQG